jgi:RimJ/RimL family protein N-acetyltransferase
MAKRHEAERPLYVRPLTPEDASIEYANWLGDATTNRFLETKSATVSELRDYISSHLMKDDSLLLGIFLRQTDVHIGNIKFEPIELIEGRAELGIMIGSSQHRGIGLGPQAIKAGVQELVSRYSSVRLITLGVKASNFPAIRAYERLGFQSALADQFGQSLSTQDRRLEVAVSHLLK